MSHSGLWIPKHLRPAVKRIRIVFYYNPAIDRVEVGFPEEFDCPLPGYQKIVCQTARDVEKWSEKKRQQDRRDKELTDEQREAIEGPVRDAVRKELVSKMMNSRNQINRDFCRWALQKMDEQDDLRKKQKIESYMHSEGFEDGK